jgi:hypothetical protein
VREGSASAARQRCQAVPPVGEQVGQCVGIALSHPPRDQDVTPFIDRDALALNEFILQIV